MKRIAIVGVGGIGGFVGAKLCLLAQHTDEFQICFLQRGEHLLQIQKDGLTYLTKNKYIVTPSIATDDPHEIGLVDLIVFCVKSRDLELSALSLAPCIHGKTVLLPTLNGVVNQQRLQQIYPQNIVLNGCIYVSAGIKEAGTVAQMGGAGHLCFGHQNEDLSQFSWIDQMFFHAGIKSKLTSDIETEVWRKYLFVSSLATITSIYKEPVGFVAEHENIRRQWIELIDEIMLIARSQNVLLREEDKRSVLERIRLLPYETKTSMQLDFENGKIPELDIFTEYICNTARKNAALVPLHSELLAQLKRRLP